MNEETKQKMEKLNRQSKMIIQNIVKIKNRIVYKIVKNIYNLKYRRLTFISEKGMWVSTVVFPVKLTEDGICGVTDVFAGDKKKVDFEPLHSVYIKNPSESSHIHEDVVKCVKGGYIMKNIL